AAVLVSRKLKGAISPRGLNLTAVRPRDSENTEMRIPDRRPLQDIRCRSHSRTTSRFELPDGYVGVAEPKAELAGERRQKIDRDIGIVLAQCREGCVAKAETGNVLIGDHSRRTGATVKDGELAKYGARRKGRESNATAVIGEMNAGSAPGDDE